MTSNMILKFMLERMRNMFGQTYYVTQLCVISVSGILRVSFSGDIKLLLFFNDNFLSSFEK